MKTTKRALFSSVIALILCFSMLVGTTFAWFTDEVKSANNIITAGNLDVELYYTTDPVVAADPTSTQWEKVDTNTNVFDKTLWEPGKTQVVYLKVANEGTLALKYQLGVNVASEKTSIAVVDGKDVELKLSNHIKFGVLAEQKTFANREEAIAAVDASATPLSKAYNSGTLTLDSKDAKVVTMVVYMPTSVGNEANHKPGENAPEINLGINLFATQVEANIEQDSFGPDYDKDAWHKEFQVASADDLQDALNNAQPGDTISVVADITSENGFVISGTETIAYSSRSTTNPIVINLNGNTLTATGKRAYLFTVEGDASVTILNGKLVAESTNGMLNGTGTSTGASSSIYFKSTGTLIVENVEIQGSVRGGHRAIDIYDGNAVLNNVKITSAYGAGVVAGGEGVSVVLNNCDITVNGMYSAPYNSVCFGVWGGAEMIVNSGNYKMINDNTYSTGDTHGGWVGIVMSSGGTITTYGGTFTNVPAPGFNPAYERAIFEAENNAPAVATLNLLGGTFIPQEEQIYAGYGDKYYPTYNVPNLIDCGNGVWVAAPAGVDKVIMTAADLHALGGTKISGTYSLMADIDMTGYEMKPIAISGSSAELIFLGNGHTISNLTLVSDTQNGMPVSALFNVWYSGKAITVNDLTIKDATSTCDDYSAIVVAYNSFADAVITLNNVDVVGAKVNGATAAGLVGYSTGVTNLTDCDVSDLTLNGERADKIGTYIGTANTATCTVTVANCTNSTTYRDYGRVINGATWNGGFAVSNTEQLITAIKAAPVGQETVIWMATGTYAGDIKITLADMGKQSGDVVIKALEGAKPVITGTVTLGYRNQGVGAAMWNANVTFEGITFDHADVAKHSISVGDVKSLTLKNCTIIGDGEYGITSDRGNATGTSQIVGCTFQNAGMQLLGNFATGLVIDDCTFYESRINVQAGNGVTVQKCTFNNTLTAANVDDSFYAIRSNSTPITVKNCEFHVDSELTEVATAQAKWYLLANRGTTNWTVENVAVTLTNAALAQTELVITACTSTGKINTTNLTVNGEMQ